MSLEKLPSSKWRAVVRHQGRKAVGRAVATRAEAAMLEAQLKLELGAPAPERRHSVLDVIDGYLADNSGRLSPETLKYYREGRDTLFDEFLDRDVSSINAFMMDRLYATLQERGCSAHKIAKCHRVLSAAFNRAVKYGWMPDNPCRLANRPSIEEKEVDPPTSADVRAIIKSSRAVNEDLGDYFTLAAATGVRRGEGVALKWSDLRGGRLTVHRSIIEVDGKLIERSTKTGSKGHRTISLDPGTVTLLDGLHRRQLRAADDQLLPAPVYLFSHDAGVTPWRPAYITTAFARLAGPRFSVHDLRHFHATQLLGAGVPVPTVSKRLGHTSPAVTLRVYAHWIPEQDEEASAIIGDLLHAPSARRIAGSSRAK
jgi:integrase